MSNPPVNVSALVPWRRLLERLGVEAPDPGARAGRCPACRRPTMTTYQDTVLGGHWHHCAGCAGGWDSLELAAVALGGGVADAAAQLVDWGLLEADRAGAADVEAYDAWYVRRRAATAAFWRAASEALPGSGAATHAARAHLGLGQVEPVTWAARGGTMVGTAPIAEVIEHLGRSAVFGGGQDGARGLGRRRKASDEAVVVPFGDLPGRISAFMCVVVDRAGNLRKYFRHAFSATAKTNPYTRVGGVAPAAAVLTPPGGSLVLSTEPVLALRLQMRHQDQAPGYLPLAAVWAEGPPCAAVRDVARHRDVVVWTLAPDADAFRHARALDARMYWPLTPDMATQSHVLWQFYRAPGEYLKTLAANALPWREALHKFAAAAPAHEVAAVVDQLGADREDFGAVLAGAPKAARAALAAAAPAAPAVPFGRREVVVTADEWRLATGELVTDAPFRLDEVLICRATGGAWYRGAARYKGAEYPFLTPRDEFEAKPFQTVRSVLLAAGAGLARYNDRVSRRAVEVALALREPRTTWVPRPGWDAAGDRLVFHDYAVGLGGAVTDLTRPAGGLTPAGVLPRPAPVDADELAALAEPGVGRLVWPAAAAVLYNLVAPAFGRPPRGVLLTGHSRPALEALAALGCPVLNASLAGSGRAATIALMEREAAGGWPLAVGRLMTKSPALTSWASEPGRNVAVEVADRLADTLLAAGGWFRVDVPSPRVLRPETARACGRLAADAAHFAVSRRLGGAARDADLAEWVAAELDAYAAARGGPPVGAHLSGLLWRPADRAGAMRELVHGLVRSGLVTETRGVATPTTRDRGMDVRLTDAAAWVPQAALADLLAGREELPPRAAGVTASLKAAGVLVDEVPTGGEVFWLLARDWYEGGRRTRAPALRVANAED